MWKDASSAVQDAAKIYFTNNPATETMLASADGSLFSDDAAGAAFANQHAQAANVRIVRLTRAGAVVPYTSAKGQGMRGGESFTANVRHY